MDIIYKIIAKHLDHSWYLSGWPEGGCRLGAEELGHTLRHIQKTYQ